MGGQPIPEWQIEAIEGLAPPPRRCDRGPGQQVIDRFTRDWRRLDYSTDRHGSASAT